MAAREERAKAEEGATAGREDAVPRGKKVRMNVTFSPKYYEILSDLADESESSKADVIRDALAFQDWVHDVRRKGGRIIVERENGERAEILPKP